jgi:hypothetical protein
MLSSSARGAIATAALLLLATTVALAATIAHDLTGRWDFAVVTENGTGTPVVAFKQAGEKLTGTYESRMLGSRTLEGTQKGDSLRFTLSSTGDANAIALTFVGVVVDKDNVKGIVDFAGMGSATFTGIRQRAP